MSAILVAIGEVVAGVLGWFTLAITEIETALAASVLLQIGLGLGAVVLAFMVVRLVVNMIKGFVRK